MPLVPPDHLRQALGAPLAYPSISPARPGVGEETIMLVPTLAHRPGQCVALPAADAEVAAELVRRFDKAPIQFSKPSPILHKAAVSVSDALGSQAKSTSLAAVDAYFEAVLKTREVAIRSMADTMARFHKAGGTLTDADFADLLIKRRAAQEILLSTRPPAFRFEVVGKTQFDEMSRLGATIASLPPGRARAELERQWRVLQDRFVANFPSKSLVATKAWATRMTNAGTILMVVEFGSNVAKLLTARTKADANKAAEDLAKQGFGIFADWLAKAVVSGAAWGLAVTFGITPVGWVVVAAGFVAGVAAGYYLPDLAMPFVQPFLDTTDLPLGLP